MEISFALVFIEERKRDDGTVREVVFQAWRFALAAKNWIQRGCDELKNGLLLAAVIRL